MNTFLKYITQRGISTWSEWDRFWFQPTTGESLGLLRIITGLMLLYTHGVWGLALDAFFGSQGWQDPILVQTFHRESNAMSFWSYVSDDWLWPVHLTCLGVLTCFCLGLATRLTSILSFVIVVSYANRVPLATFGLDQINGLLTLYLAIGPSGDCYSLDRIWRRYREALAALRDGATSWKSELPCTASAQLATRLIQVHLCILYTTAGLAKLKGEAWWDGNAVWMGAANFEYQSGDLTWLAWYPWVGNLITHATVFWELTFATFVWNPRWRKLVLAVGVAMHLGIGAFLGMWTFGLVMIFAYVGFVPAQSIDSLFRRMFETPKIVVPFQPEVPKSVRQAAWRCEFSWVATIELQPVVMLQVAPVMPSPQAIPAPLVAQTPVSVGEWWRQLTADPNAEWKLLATQPDKERHPNDILIVSSMVAHQTKSQEYFNERGFVTRIANDVQQACVALTCRAAKGVIIYAYHPQELEDIRQFRELCHRGGIQAPITVVAMYRDLLETIDWEPLREHPIVIFPASLRELRYSAHDAWITRNGTRPENDDTFAAENNAADVLPFTPSPAVDTSKPEHRPITIAASPK